MNKKPEPVPKDAAACGSDGGNDQPSVKGAFRMALNQHGYGFQYAALKEAERLRQSGKSRWIPWVPEFPVEVQGSGARIDFVLRHENGHYYIVAECKRANPATANWCFARAWQPNIAEVYRQSYVEVAYFLTEGEGSETGLKALGPSERIFQIALEVRTNKKGNEGGKGRGEIEEAATQVCRGLNGLIQMFHERGDRLLQRPSYVGIIPAIFTTARLLSTDIEVSAADLKSGDLAELPADPAEKDWLWYDYPQSPGLKHSLPSESQSRDLREVVFHDYIRRIAIVAPGGIGSFLCQDVWLLLGGN